MINWTLKLYDHSLSWLMCLPYFFPLLHLLNSILRFPLPFSFIPRCFNPSICYYWKFHLVLLLLYIWINTMPSLSDISAVLNIFMHIPGFLKREWSDAKQHLPPPPFLLIIIYLWHEFLSAFLDLGNLIDCNKICIFLR